MYETLRCLGLLPSLLEYSSKQKGSRKEQSAWDLNLGLDRNVCAREPLSLSLYPAIRRDARFAFQNPLLLF